MGPTLNTLSNNLKIIILKVFWGLSSNRSTIINYNSRVVDNKDNFLVTIALESQFRAFVTSVAICWTKKYPICSKVVQMVSHSSIYYIKSAIFSQQPKKFSKTRTTFIAKFESKIFSKIVQSRHTGASQRNQLLRQADNQIWLKNLFKNSPKYWQISGTVWKIGRLLFLTSCHTGSGIYTYIFH